MRVYRIEDSEFNGPYDNAELIDMIGRHNWDEREHPGGMEDFWDSCSKYWDASQVFGFLTKTMSARFHVRQGQG